MGYVLVILSFILGGCINFYHHTSPVTSKDKDGNTYRTNHYSLVVTTETACEGTCKVEKK